VFTGLVADTGTIRAIHDGRLEVETALGAHLAEGDSVAVNGVCLTAVEPHTDGFAADVMPETLRRSSIAVDGVSLTVSAVEDDWFEVSLIPETLERTTLGGAEAGSTVNLEVDVLAKYVEKLMSRGAGQ
jgi:riboflavin synthase